MTQYTRSKKIWLVNRDFQLRYAAAGLLAGLASTFITATLIIYPLFAFKILTVGVFLPWPIISAICIAITLNAGLQILIGIMLTHRIAGPIFSIVRQLRIIGGGRWNVQLGQRNHDELGMVVRHINEMSECLTKVAREDLNSLNQIESALGMLKVENSQLKIIAELIEDLKTKLQQRISGSR